MKVASDLLMGEQIKLRAELAHLKDCQLRYFSLSVTATGVLVSIGTQLPTGRVSPLYYLAPLLIVVPCWWIFFDKATTITRIVGYLRLIDDFFRYSNNDVEGPRFLGWETALQLRRNDKPSSEPSKLAGWKEGYSIALSRVLPLNTTHRYWGFTWYTFLLLSLTCVVLAWSSADTHVDALWRSGWTVSAAVVFVAALYNLYLVGDLTGGRRSYDKHYEEWCRIHRENQNWSDIWAKREIDTKITANPTAQADGYAAA
jgi:hypothetical protein